MRAGFFHIQLTEKNRLNPVHVFWSILNFPGLSLLAYLPGGSTQSGARAHLRILSLLSLFHIPCTHGTCILSVALALCIPTIRSSGFNQTRHIVHQSHQIPPFWLVLLGWCFVTALYCNESNDTRIIFFVCRTFLLRWTIHGSLQKGKERIYNTSEIYPPEKIVSQ